MKRLILISLLLIFRLHLSYAEEGMWIPMLIEQLNLKQMTDLGLKLSAEDIYSVNHSSLKDAIVQFGGGCTAEIISSSGLILTNHHCGYGAIQRQSSLEHDYLADGFWAPSVADELPAPGLTVTLLVRMEDVTEGVLQGVTSFMNQFQRNQRITQNIDKIEKESVREPGYEAKVKPFFYGNQYYLIISEVFKDVRLVGAPPSSIGKFGGDTDNWMWPRHTGDFSLFRIYVNKNNEPAAYSKENVPYRPKNFLPISIRGYKKDDFTFVFGYPGNTREYVTSFAVDLTAFSENPLRIGLRQKRLDIINDAMKDNRKVRIQYSAKAAGIANYWKKMIGETRGIERLHTVATKNAFENRFQSWADSSIENRSRFRGLLPALQTVYKNYLPVDLSSIYITEAGQAIEIVKFAAGFRDFIKLATDKKSTPESLVVCINNLRKSTRDFFRNYSLSIDQKLMPALLTAMGTGMDESLKPDIFHFIDKKFGGDIIAYSRYVFENSILIDSTRLLNFFSSFTPKSIRKLEKDPAYQLAFSIYSRQERDIAPKTMEFSATIDSLQRIYMAGQMQMQRNHIFYPDANLSLRIAYGKVDDYHPADGVTYQYFTTLAGVMQKEDSSIYDYQVAPKLSELFYCKDFGKYADADGAMHVAFTASNHTTGGNSGSPVLNGNGQLIGVNFDRNWEGTMSDLMYDPEQCRNITLDIRYCLFIIDKMAGARRLINEMRIIE